MRDTLSELSEAITRLDHVLRSIGPGIELSAIEVGGSRYAGRILSDAIKASPSFLSTTLYQDCADRSPQSLELCGVSVRSKADV